MDIWLATLNDYDGKSIVGVYSSTPLALKGVIDYLVAEDDIKYPELFNKQESDDLLTYDIMKSTSRVVIRKMKLDK